MLLQMGFGDLEYLIPYIFTLILMAAKLSFGLYLINREKSAEQKNYFIHGAAMMMFGICISRTCYFIFDFHMVFLDPNLYYLSPNVWVWKFGNLISSLSMAYLIFVLDKKILNNKFKGIFTFAIAIISIVQFLYPVNSSESFQTASTIGVFAMALGLILPLTFLYLGFKTSGELKKVSYLLALGIILYAAVGQLVNETFLNTIGAQSGTTLRLVIYAVVPILKIGALGLITYCATKFRYK